MKIRIWQIMGLTAWLALVLAVSLHPKLSTLFRIGWVLMMLGLLFTFGRPLLPTPEPRPHVDNEVALSKVFDTIFLIIPAFFLLWFGVSMMVLNPVAGFLFSLALITLNVTLLWHPGDSDPKQG